jgi:hypothetical protein
MTHQMLYGPIDDFCANNRFVRNIIYYINPEADLLGAGRLRPEVVAESDYNIFWHAQGAAFFKDRKLTPLGTLAQWQEAGYDKHSLIVDPLFVDPAKDDYRLKPEAPAFKLGFQDLPWDKIGLQGYARSWRMTASK